MKSIFRHLLAALALLLTVNLQFSYLQAQGTAFTYQGQLLNNGSLASGSYDLTFTLFDTNTDGTAIVGPVTNTAVAVSNGLFTVLIDFGPGVFTGATNWLEIAVSTNGANSFTTLAPRQQLTPTPDAIYAENAGNLSGTLLASQLTSIGNTNGGLGNFFIGPSGNVANSGYDNTANGYQALLDIANGSFNTANGYQVLHNNTSGSDNTANGAFALLHNTSGYGNTANGFQALDLNENGIDNTAAGAYALLNNTSGSNNIALGWQAGYSNSPTASSNIDIGNEGLSTDTNIIRIGSGQSQTFIAGVINGSGGGLTNLNGSSIQSGTVGATQLTPGIGTVPSGTLVLSSTENNAALTNAGFALLISAIQGVTWNAATDAALWAPRSDLQGLAFGNQLWVLGGENQSFAPFNDVWSSSNGIAWTEATSAAPWGARDDFGAAVLGNQMWVMGGAGTFLFNDVWSSTNGINWAEATNAAPWTGRYALGAVAFSNQLWVLGGTSNGSNYFNDVWSSSNGVVWKEATNTAAWGPRGYFGCAVMNGQMYVMGGLNNSVTFDDVWASSNGTIWTELTNAAPWGQRYGFGVVPASGQLWVMGGLNGSSMETSDVWASSNGVSWIEVTNAAPWGPRIVFGDATLSNQIWLLGGYSAGNVTNDVWFSPTTAPGMVGGYYLYQKQ